MAQNQTNPCPICNLDNQVVEDISIYEEKFRVDCKRCGKFKIPPFPIEGIIEYIKRQQLGHKLSAWIRERNEQGIDVPEIKKSWIKDIEQILPDYSPADKHLILLRNIGRKSSYPGKMVTIDPLLDYPLAWASNQTELVFYLLSLVDRKLLDNKGAAGGRAKEIRANRDCDVVITAAGWDYLDKHAVHTTTSIQAFVAMSFSEKMRPVWKNAIKPAIKKSGYNPYKVDVDPHIERIDAKIIAEIKNSRFLVADVTEQKHGVYFEAGYALGLNMPVIWCVQKADLDNVHFDTRQYNHIVWESEEDLKERLYNFICAVIGKVDKPSLET